MINHAEAEDQTYGVFYEELKASAVAIFGYIPEVRWHNKEDRTLPDISKFYIRASFEVIESEQSAFGVSEPGARRLYSNEGIATFAIHSPRSVAGADRKAVILAQKLKTAFRKPRTSCDVWFRRQRIQKTYPEDQFLRTNFTTEFYFTEDD